jgi:Fe2+ or Zn2+ uptake regulation protein
VDADAQMLASCVEQAQRQYHFSIDWQHLSVQGICQACQEKMILQEV